VHLPVLLIALPIWALAFHFTGLYRAPTPRVGLRETGAVVRGTLFAALGLAFCLFAFKLILTSRIVIAAFVALSVPAVVAARTASGVLSSTGAAAATWPSPAASTVCSGWPTW